MIAKPSHIKERNLYSNNNQLSYSLFQSFLGKIAGIPASFVFKAWSYAINYLGDFWNGTSNFGASYFSIDYIVLPMTISWIANCCIFSHLHQFSPDNYQKSVREYLEDTLIEYITKLFQDLFPYGLSPFRSSPFLTIVQNYLNTVDTPGWLNYVSYIYKCLVENGIESTFFNKIVLGFITMIRGGGQLEDTLGLLLLLMHVVAK